MRVPGLILRRAKIPRPWVGVGRIWMRGSSWGVEGEAEAGGEDWLEMMLQASSSEIGEVVDVEETETLPLTSGSWFGM